MRSTENAIFDENQDARSTAIAETGRQVQCIRAALDDDGLRLLGSMAGKVTLKETAAAFPHVINELGAFVRDPQAMVKAIDGLLVDDRADRHGMPFLTVRELANLRARYAGYLELLLARRDVDRR